MTASVDRASARVAAPTPGERAARARATVVRALEASTDALAAWEAGSAAFGRADEHSDLDVVVLCTAGAGTAVLDAVDEALATVTDGLCSWYVGELLFGVQQFWREPQDADPSLICMLDVSVIELEAQADKWQELLLPERHGRALPIYDPDALLELCRAQSTLDLEAHASRIAEAFATIEQRHAMLAEFPAKELARGRALDAQAMHQALLVKPLVTLLGIRHRPLRFDFDQRYLHDELPDEVARQLVPIACASSDTLAAATVEAREWIDELLATIDLDAIPLAEHAAQMRAAFG